MLLFSLITVNVPFPVILVNKTLGVFELPGVPEFPEVGLLDKSKLKKFI